MEEELKQKAITMLGWSASTTEQYFDAFRKIESLKRAESSVEEKYDRSERLQALPYDTQVEVAHIEQSGETRRFLIKYGFMCGSVLVGLMLFMDALVKLIRG